MSLQVYSTHIKVFLLIYRDDERSGGSLRVAEVLANSIIKLNVEVYVVVAYGGGGRLKAIFGDRCILMKASGPKDFKAWLDYRKLVMNLSPHLIHYIDTVGWMVFAALGLKPKRVMHQHFRPDVGPNGYKRLKWIKLFNRNADKVVAISHGAGRQLVEKCAISSSKVEVLHNAVDFDYLKSEGKKRDLNKCILGMAVRVVEDKGIEDALNLIKILPIRYELVVAGDGPALSNLKQKAKDIGVFNRVRWCGSVADISSFYSGIDFYLFMSWYEGFGLSVAEAMGAGKPVVGFLGDGEIAESEFPLVTSENAILVPRSSPCKFGLETDENTFLKLRDEILKLDTNQEMQAKYVRNGYDWVRTRFSSDLYAKKMLEIYKRALGI